MEKVNKITTIHELSRKLEPKTSAVISGSFDPFNNYYKDLLKWASSVKRPLIVIVNTDKVIYKRRGLVYPLLSERKRAEKVASLDFVDYVVISPEGAQSPIILKNITPNFLLLQQDNTNFLRGITEVINNKFPHIKTLISPVPKEVKFPVRYFLDQNKKSSSFIVNRLLDLAKTSKAPIGKISAVLVLNNKIVLSASNSMSGEHAESIILRDIKKGDHSDYVLYILIPPCPMCAKSILSSRIKKIFYLFDYGDGYGTEILNDAGIFTNKIKE